jgi:hypothetical protein
MLVLVRILKRYYSNNRSDSQMSLSGQVIFSSPGNGPTAAHCLLSQVFKFYLAEFLPGKGGASKILLILFLR